MAAWLTIGFLVALIGSQATANDVYPDLAENVNTRMAGSRIVSGWEAPPGMLPHQVSIRMVNFIGQVSACGGSIIHEEWVMTAAHCTAGRANLVIRAGVVNLTQPEYIYETNQWWNHPLYNDNLPAVVQPHDISVVKLQKKVTYSRNLQPIRLQNSADKDKNYHDIRLSASGWGLTWTQGTGPENLNWVYLRGVTNFDCWVTYGFSPIIADSTICARYYNVTSQSTCQGDSGGPLTVLEQDGKTSMVGVASFVSGSGCHTEHPAGFIRPGHYHDWYFEVTGIDFDWRWEENTTTVTVPTTEEVDTTTVVTTTVDTTTEVTTPVDTTTVVTTTVDTTTEVTTPVDTTTEVTTPVDTTTEVTTPVDTTTEVTTPTKSSEEKSESSEEDSESSEEDSESSEEKVDTTTEVTPPAKSSEEKSESSEEDSESSEEKMDTTTEVTPPAKSSEEKSESSEEVKSSESSESSKSSEE